MPSDSGSEADMDEGATIQGLVDALRRRESSAVELVDRYLQRIDRLNSSLNCFCETYPERAHATALQIDQQLAAGDQLGPLAGVPIAVKDNIVTDFGHTRCGSRFLENYKSPYASTAVERLEQAGAIIIGKTNCDEFGMGSSTEHCAFGAAHNPWDITRVPGGSSGGSAAAVTADLCCAALGSDTGGSIRQPAAFCGIVGAKPSYGRVSRYGLVAFGSSLDQIGPLARTVQDAALLLGVLAGADRHDSTCADRPVPDYVAQLETPTKSLRIGVPKQFLSDDNDPGVNAAVRDAIAVYRSHGAEIIEIDLPLSEYGIATYYVIAPAEASSNLARYDGIRYGRRAELGPDDDLLDLYARSRAEGFGPEVQRRIMLGTYVLSAGYYEAYYKRALQVRRLIKQELDAAFAQCDALLGPTTPTVAFSLGEKADPLSMYLCDVYTTIANIAGICAISIPAGFVSIDGKRLPVGIQIQCQAFDEATMFRIARMFEAATDHHTHRPDIDDPVRSTDIAR